jgi:hypothetical protein
VRETVRVGATIIAMWNTVIGGAVALAGVALAQWWQSRRAGEDAERRRMAEKAGRLRAAYHDVVAAAERLRGRAFELMELGDEIARSPADWRRFVQKIAETDDSISDARTALLLEAEDADRAVLTAFTSASEADTKFKLALMKRAGRREKGDNVPATELHEAMHELEQAVDKVAKLARQRLVGLEAPPGLKAA